MDIKKLIMEPLEDLKPQLMLTPFDNRFLGIPENSDFNVDEILREFFKGREFTFFSRAQYGLVMLLRHLKENGFLADDSEICFRTTSGSPYIAGCLTRGVEEADLKWNQEINDKTKIIIAIHEWGFPNKEAPELRRICDQKNIILIEDCAYVWKSGEAGKYGDYILYSLKKIFPMRFGGILVGKKFSAEELKKYNYLDLEKEEICRKYLSYYLSSFEDNAKKRIENYKYVENIFGSERAFFNLEEGVIPSAFILKVDSLDKMKKIREYALECGIECGAYWQNSAVFFPIHQNLDKVHLDYVCDTISKIDKNFMKVPFVDLTWQYKIIKLEVWQELENIFDNSSFILGPKVENFEKNFSAFLNAPFVVGVNNGTSALYLALRALDVGAGDEVITVANTFFATAEAISMTGAKPIFVDIDENCLIDSTKIELAITEKTKVIIPVHLYGQCADMDMILQIAQRHNLFVVEDACQAHGAEYQGKKAGIMGDAGCFSFYPGKNLGAFGEAGAVATNKEDIAEKIKMLREHGSSKKYYHDLVGTNMRMSAVQGAILNIKLKHLNKWNNLRRQAARLYKEELKDLDIILPRELGYGKHVYHLFVIQTEKRDELADFLKENGIETGIHYPVPIYRQEAYKNALQNFFCPLSERTAKKILSLPIYPGISDDQIRYVCQTIKEFFWDTRD